MKLKNPAAFFAGLVHLFPYGLTQSQVGGINTIVDALPASMGAQQAAYCLATAYWETAQTMHPIEEYGLGRSHFYGKSDQVTHQSYYGRGYVQLTRKANYERATKRLHELGLLIIGDLVAHPEFVLRPEVAGYILAYGMIEGWFTGKKLSDYFSTTRSDAIHAREIINGMDHANEIAGFFIVFLAALRSAGVEPIITIQPPASSVATNLENRVAELEAYVKEIKRIIP